MNVSSVSVSRQEMLYAGAGLAVVAVACLWLFGPVDASSIAMALRFTVPIGFAALGGIFSEKAGIINIGLEGLLIIGAFSAVASMYALSLTPIGANVWLAFGFAIVASAVVALLFAIACIEFKADQVIAGLAVWLIALGFAPFASTIVWGQVNSPSVDGFSKWAIPGLADLPVFGDIFVMRPPVMLLIVAGPLTWYVLNRTRFGLWIEASGEDPKALDTAGVDVQLVRYVGTVLSGVYCGIGGAALALRVGQFTGGGETMVNGRGFIGLTAYLIGNYNPIGAFFASFLFGGLEVIQLSIQRTSDIGIPTRLVGVLPYVIVLVVLVFVGKTQMPSSAGDHYESDD
nr:ABC transporter permease [Halostagnicola sp. A56]